MSKEWYWTRTTDTGPVETPPGDGWRMKGYRLHHCWSLEFFWERDVPMAGPESASMEIEEPDPDWEKD